MKTTRIKTAVTTACILLCGAALLWRAPAVASGISRGLSVCGSVLIPSVFPFLVLGGFLIRSGVASALGRRLESITRVLFGLPGCTAAGVLLGLIGGYPAGSVAVGELMRSGQITRDEARRMLRFCVNGGPGFVISAVGAGLMGNVQFGVLLFVAHVTAALILGVVGVPRGARKRDHRVMRTAPRAPLSSALVDAVTGACETMVYMCGFVLLFGGIIAVLGTFSDNRVFSALTACVLEVSGGCAAASSLGVAAPLLLGFAVGFGGLSVHCQIASSLRGLRLLDASFFLARLAHGSLTAVFTVLLLRWIPLSHPVWNAGQKPIVQSSYGSVALSVALLVFGGIWVMGHNLDKSGEKPYTVR